MYTYRVYKYTFDNEEDALDEDGLRVDLAHVLPTVVVADVADHQVPVLDVGALHADARVVDKPPLVRADQRNPGVQPD